MRALGIALAVVWLAGCSTLAGIGDWANENPLVADLVAQQAALRYIDENPDRADDFVAVMDDAIAAVDGGLVVTVDDVFNTISESIDWSSLSAADTQLVLGLMTIVQSKLDTQVGEGTLDPDELLGVRSMLVSARRAAKTQQ